MRLFEEQCMDFLEEVSRALTLLDTISAQHVAVWTKTSSLNATCERLLAEQQELRGTVEAIRKPLDHFNELERLGPLLGVPITADTNVAALDVTQVAPTNIKVHPGSPHFAQVLGRIETSLLYLARHPEFRDAALYRSKMAQLHLRALALAKIAAVDAIHSASKQAQDQIAQQEASRARAAASPAASSSSPSSSPRTSSSSSSAARSFAIPLDGRSGGGGATAGLDPSALETGAAYGKFRSVQIRVGELTKMLQWRSMPPPPPSVIEAALVSAKSPKTKNKKTPRTKNKKQGGGGSSDNKAGGPAALAAAAAEAVEAAAAGGNDADEEAALAALGPEAKAALASHSAGSTPQAKALLEDCVQSYLSARVGLLRPAVAHYLAALSAHQGLMGLARLGSSYLARLCRLEKRLFLSFFATHQQGGRGGGGDSGMKDPTPTSSAATSSSSFTSQAALSESHSEALHLMLVDLCQAMYASMRPFLIQQNDLDALCQTVAALHEEANAQRALGLSQTSDVSSSIKSSSPSASFESQHRSSSSPTAAAALTVSTTAAGAAGAGGGGGSDSEGGSDGGGTAAVVATLDRLVADAQERLIYCALLVLRDEIEHFNPTPKDLDYPERLRRANVDETAASASAAAATAEAAADGSGCTSGETPSDLPSKQASKFVALAVITSGEELKTADGGGGGDVTDAGGSGGGGGGHEALYSSWYGPLRSTLVVLSKIYRAVDNAVFEDLAGEAVGLCTDALKQGSLAVTAKKGDTVDGDLFLVKHLLILREQLTPFDINFSQLRRKLDFTSTRAALGSFFRAASGGSVGSALMELAKQGLPQVDEHFVDAKHDLEDALKRACTRFISQASTDLMEPLLNFVQLAKAFPLPEGPASSSAPPAGGASGLASSLDAAKIREQAFAKPDRVRECLSDAMERCGAVLLAGGGQDAAAAAKGAAEASGQDAEGKKRGPPPKARAEKVWSRMDVTLDKMALFLDSAVTRSILFKPIQRKIVTAVSECRAVVALLFSSSSSSSSSSSTEPLSEFLNRLSAIEHKVLSVDLDAPPSLTPPPALVVRPPPPPPPSRKQAGTLSPSAHATAAAAATAPKQQRAPTAGAAAGAGGGSSGAASTASSTGLKEVPTQDASTPVAAAAATNASASGVGLAEVGAGGKKNEEAEAQAAEAAAAEAQQQQLQKDEEHLARLKQEAEEAEAAEAEAKAKAAELEAMERKEKEEEQKRQQLQREAEEALKKKEEEEEEEKQKQEAAAAAAAAEAEALKLKEGASSAPAPLASGGGKKGGGKKQEEGDSTVEEDEEEAAVRAKLVAFYQKHNPTKVGEVDGTIAKFKGRYDVLFAKLNKKYGVKG